MTEDINTQDVLGETRLFEAVSEDNVDEVSRLLSLGADPNISENNGITPLMEAVSNGNLQIARSLLGGGADPHLLDNFGATVLDWAKVYPEAADLIRSHIVPHRLETSIRTRERTLAEDRRKVVEIVRNLPETRTLDIHCVLRDGDLECKALSEGEARQFINNALQLRNDLGESSEDDIDHGNESWSIDVRRELVGVVDGVLWGCGTEDAPRPHVSWKCPACAATHNTDLEEGEPNPVLWGCEAGFGDAWFLVRRRHENGDVVQQD